jgi:hypothetical protein
LEFRLQAARGREFPAKAGTLNTRAIAIVTRALDDEVWFDPLDHGVELAQVVERGIKLAVVFERELDEAALAAQALVTLADSVDDVLGLCDFVRVSVKILRVYRLPNQAGRKWGAERSFF